MKKCRKKHKVGPKAGLAMDKEIKVVLRLFCSFLLLYGIIKTLRVADPCLEVEQLSTNDVQCCASNGLIK